MTRVLLFVACNLFFVVVYGQHLYHFSTDKGCGFVNSAGEVVVQPQFLECSYSYEHQVAYTKSQQGWQIINRAAQPIVEERYDSITHWGKGLILAQNQQGIAVFLREDNKVKLQYSIDSLRSYKYKERDYLQVFQNRATFLVSTNAKSYFEGLGLDSLSSNWDNSFIVSKDGLYGILDINGEAFLSIDYDSLQYYDAGLKYYKNGKVGYKKQFFYRDLKTKKQVEMEFPADYDEIINFGKHFVKLVKDNQINLFDIETQELITDDLPANALPFNQYFHKLKQGRLVGLCSLDGTPLTTAKYSKLLDSGHPKRVLFTKGGFFGFIDEDGNELTEAKFEKLYPFEAWGLLPRPFTKYKEGRLFGLVDINGDTLTGAKYLDVRLISDDRAACMKSDSSAVVYILDKRTGSIEDWYDLSHINQLNVVRETKSAGINDLYVGEERYNDKSFSYYVMNNNYGKKERYDDGRYSNILMKEIEEYKLFLLFIPWGETFDPTDEIFTVLTNYTTDTDNGEMNRLDVTDEYYKSVALIGDNVLRGVRISGDVDYLDLSFRRMYLSYKHKYGTDKFLVKDILNGNKYYPRVYEVEKDMQFKRYLLPYSKFTKNHIEPIYDSLILKGKTVFGRTNGYWDFAKPDTLSLPNYTVGVSMNDTVIMSHSLDTSYYVYDNKGNEKYRFESFELIHESDNGMALVKTDTLYNYLNPFGELILDTSVSEASEFQHGFAFLKLNEKYSIINRKGEVVLDSLSRALKFNRKGVAVYYENKKYGLLDTTGAIVDTAKYNQIKVIKGTDYYTFKVERNSELGVLNSKGEVVLESGYKKIKSLGGALLSLETATRKRGVFNLQTKELIKPKYDKVKSAGNQSVIISKGTMVGLYNQDKGWLVPVKQKSVSGFRYGFATIKSKKENFYVLEDGTITTDQPKKVYPIKAVADTLTYDKKDSYVGLNKVNIPIRYDKVIQLEKNKSYIGMRFSKFTLHDYVGTTKITSDTWLSSEILDKDVLRVNTVEGIKYYNLLTEQWF